MTGKPKWHDVAMERVHDSLNARRSQHKAPKKAKWGHDITLRSTKDFMALAHEAAELHDITVGGFMRRAIAKQIALTLGMDVRDVLSFNPMPARYGSSRSTRGPDGEVQPDTGEGFGDWAW